MRPLKKTLLALLAPIVFAAAAFAQADVIEGKDPPEGFEWDFPQKNEIGFRLIAMDGKPKTFYIRRGDFFAPVEANSARALSSPYPTARKGEIEFFSRQTFEDKIFFKPVFKISTEGAKDLLILLKERDDKSIEANAINISFEKYPKGSIAIINLLNRTVGVGLGKKFAKLEPLKSAQVSFAGEPDVYDVPVKLFAFKNGKARLAYSRTVSFCSDERMAVFVFRLPNPDAPSQNGAPPLVFMYGGSR